METGLGMVRLEAIRTVRGGAFLAEVVGICLDWSPVLGLFPRASHMSSPRNRSGRLTEGRKVRGKKGAVLGKRPGCRDLANSPKHKPCAWPILLVLGAGCLEQSTCRVLRALLNVPALRGGPGGLPVHRCRVLGTRGHNMGT